MNYEDFYQDLLPQQKNVKDGLAALQKLFKAVNREVEGGDVKSLVKDMETMVQAVSALADSVKAMKASADGFDAKGYFESGEFAAQILAACAEKGVDVRGESPVYEMFPYRVKIDAENQDLYLDRKKVQCMRPESFVDIVKNGQDRLNKAPFNAMAFASELSDAYDLAILKYNRQPQSDIYLTNLYKVLAPMSRFRKDYDQQSFAFDLARLYISGIEETKNGKKFQFGPTRVGQKAIRILGRDGKEQFLATIRFYE